MVKRPWKKRWKKNDLAVCEEEKGDGATEQEQRDVEQKQREIRKTTGESEQGESHNCRSVPSGADVL